MTSRTRLRRRWQNAPFSWLSLVPNGPPWSARMGSDGWMIPTISCARNCALRSPSTCVSFPWWSAVIAAVAALVILAVILAGVRLLHVEPFSLVYPVWTAWLDTETYQHEVDRQLKNKWYPSKVE